VEQQTGKYPGPELEIPPDLVYLWSWFTELSSTRGGGWGPSPITYMEIKAWAELTGNCPDVWEVSVLKAMDNKYLEMVNRLEQKKVKK
jgi:hypothetical protein